MFPIEANRKQELLDALKWRLHEREIQEAKYGVSVDPVITIEISSLRKRIEEISQGLSGAWTTQEHRGVLHNLPQRDYTQFFGRKEELEKLQRLLHPNARAWAVTIDGVGGIGKSALALETAYKYLNTQDISPEESFQAIVWVSAKSTVLTAAGILERRQSIKTLADIYNAIAITLNCEDFIEKHIDSQHSLIRRILTKNRVLLIIDNLETVDDNNVNEFIREIPSPTKCIITTRHRIDVAYSIRLTDLEISDGINLIQQESQIKQIKLTEDQVNLIYRRTGGLPLAIVWCVSQIGFGHNVNTTLKRLGEVNNDVLLFCFRESINYIKNKPSYRLLVALAISETATRSFLGQVTSLPDLDRDDGLVDLELLSLINKNGESFETIPLVTKYMLSEISEYPVSDLESMISLMTDLTISSEPLVKVNEHVKISRKLHDHVATVISDNMWKYAANYDIYSAYVLINHLERINSEVSTANLRSVSQGDMRSFIPKSENEWLSKEAILALLHLGEVEYLIDLYINSPGWPSDNYVFNMLISSKHPTTLPLIEEMIASEHNTNRSAVLKDLRTKISQQ